jgi:TadE-like protein
MISAIALIKTLLRSLRDEEGGAISVQFAIAVPLFTGLVTGIVQGGLLLFDQIELVNVTAVGSRAFALGRQPTCDGCTPQPYTNTIKAVANSGRLPLGASSVTLSVGGATCASDAACLAALNAAFYASAGHYSPALWTTVIVTRPCPTVLPASWLAFAGVCSGANNIPSGSLTAQMSREVQ